MKKWSACFIIGAALVSLAAFSGCKSGNQQGAAPQTQFSNDVSFEDIPVPAGFILMRNESYSFQNDVTRVGHLVYKGRSDINNVLAFFQQQMPLHGWQEMSYIDSTSSTRYYDKEGQTCILTVGKRTGWHNIRVDLSMRPKSK
jgi:hypothetical protein